MAESRLLGASLERMTNPHPPSSEALFNEHSDGDLAELAVATPFLQRLVAVHRMAGGRGTPPDIALRLAWTAAPMDVHRLGVLTEHEIIRFVFVAAADAKLLRVLPSPTRIVRGVESQLVVEHPLAAWSEALRTVLYGDPLGAGDEPGETVALAMLLWQYVVKGHDVELEPCVPALRQEMRDAAARDRRPPPTVDDVRGMLASLLGLLVEWGLVDWTPEEDRLGSARMTVLGALGWLCVITEQQGPTPEVDRLLTEHGYVRVEGGYVDTTVVPVAGR